MCRVLLNRHSDFLRCVFVDGRASTAPTLDSLEGIKDNKRQWMTQDLLMNIDELACKDPDGDDVLVRLNALRCKGPEPLKQDEKPKDKEELLDKGVSNMGETEFEKMCVACARLRWADLDENATCGRCSRQ